MVFKATFNNISAISWWAVLLMEEIRRPGEIHRPVASHMFITCKLHVYVLKIMFQSYVPNMQLSYDFHPWHICIHVYLILNKYALLLIQTQIEVYFAIQDLFSDL